MDIISITRSTDKSGLQHTLMVGEPIANNGVPTDNDPIVKSITFLETSAYYAKICRGPFYVIKFEEDPTISEIIPLTKVLNVVALNIKKAEAKLPELPTSETKHE